MQKLTFSYTTNNLQKLFVEKGLELLYKDTIDTYRLRLHNPKTLIKELVFNCKSAKEGILTNNQYAIATTKEIKNILKSKDDGLSFVSVNREYYLNLLKSVKKDEINRIIQASNLVLSDNQNYNKSLIINTEALLSNFSSIDDLEHNDVKVFMLHLHYHIIELINLGYTKQYLYHFFRTIFVHAGDNSLTFEDRFETWKAISSKEKERYNVIFEIIGKGFQHKILSQINSNFIPVNKKFRRILDSNTSRKVTSYLEDKKGNNLISIKVECLDHFKAVEISRSILASNLDIYHLGYNDKSFKIDIQGAVIGENQPNKSSILPINYQIDGYVRSSKHVFETILQKIKNLESNNVSPESIDKIISAVRYLRTGTESPELETQLLNYWIGLEYIFTFFNNQEKTIDLMCKYFPVCHGVIYIKRNLHDFHRALNRLHFSTQIQDYDNNLKYLTNYNNYNQIINLSDNELLKFRAKFYQKWVSDPSNISRALFKHQENLSQNIIRLYRIRNEIVHNAALTDNIFTNVSHIKYYLTFIINSLLDFMSNSPVDINSDTKITIEDYFISQDIILGSLNGKTITEYLKVRNPLELIS